MEVELPNIRTATSNDCWSLGSRQYPSGKFPKVSVGITIPRAGSVSRGRVASPAFDRNLSQGTDGISRPPKGDNTLLRVSQEAEKHDGPTKGAPEAVPVMKVSASQPDDNTREQTGTFSFGERREQVSSLDKSDTPEFIRSEKKRDLESADKSKPNSEMLRMKLREILGGASQNKHAVASTNPYDLKTPDQPKSQTAKIASSGNKEFTSPFPDNIKIPDPPNHQTVNLTKCKPSPDPIESDSDSPKVVETRPVTRSLGRKKTPAASKQQSRSAKKPLSTFQSTPKKKTTDNVFTFNEKCTPKTVVKHAIGDSGSLRKLRSSNRKARVDATSLSSLSRTGKTAESCSRSPKRGWKMNVMAKMEPWKIQFSENLLTKTMNVEQNKISPQRTSFKSKENVSSSPPPEDSDRSPHARTAAENNFNSPPSRAANPSPEPKIYPWDHDRSPETTGKFGPKVASPWTDRFRDIPDHFPSPTLAPNVNTSSSPQISKGLGADLYASKCPKSADMSRSSSLASDPESEPLDEMDQTPELPGSESPDSAEERENSKQSSLSPLSPTEDEGTKSSKPGFTNGYKSHKWLPDVDSPDKSPLEHVARKSNLKEDKMSKRRLSSPTPFAASGTQETIISDKKQEQCPENYLTRAFDQLVVVLGRFQTKIKSETSKKSSEILAATEEIIRQHLEGVEVQMQADVDKLVNAGKSKRKRLESTFEEKHEKLRVLHEKFKEEVNKQLLDCRDSLKDFESYHAELNWPAGAGGTPAARVRVLGDANFRCRGEKSPSLGRPGFGGFLGWESSHKKLLANAEKTVGAQLNDAETNIAEVQKRARKRMNGLKYVLKELIAEAAD
ncbi:hypothetical protein PVAP13_2KG495900 [Panicum virgatum]|uniref:Meiosis-specific protein ASY3-like coiled-coil domain-containing protein n=1 Tax=Panicum virgatum TaxID=38727 RepID=A0A8T0WM52_PANVG|nr:hypothetical protein PVAP13_2KG495900 [Panicum virgatum]